VISVLPVLAALGIVPERFIGAVGTLGVFATVFAESGVMVGFFLPGDSLLFTAGLLSATGRLPALPILLVGCFLAAVAGDQVGYLFGRRVGPSLFRRPDSRVFRRDRVDRAQRFFDEHGSKTIVLARFVPVVRTFAPIVAGVSRMHYRTFLTYNVVGGFLWVVGVTTLGWWLGARFPAVGEHLEVAILLIVALSAAPVGVEVLRHRRGRN
jgi:membrane-associated protein